MKQLLMTLLLALSLLFWAWMTDVLWLGALLALILLASFAFKAKYDFETSSFYQVANFSALIVAAIFAFYWLDDRASKSILPTLRLLPIALMPLLLMQYISKGFAVPVASLLFFKRKNSEHQTSFDMSVLYFALCLFSAGGVAHLGLTYFTGISVLMMLLLLIQQHGKGRQQYVILVLLFLAVEGVGLAVVYGIHDAQMRIEARINAWILSYNDGSKASSAMGEVGRLKLSDEILFRVQPKQRLIEPMLLRESTYQRYMYDTWYGGSWKDMGVAIVGEQWQLRNTQKPLQHFTIYQSFAGDKQTLALPSVTISIANLEVDNLMIKQGGRVEAQALPAFAAYDVFYTRQEVEQTDGQDSDLEVPKKEAGTIEEFVKTHNLYHIKNELGAAKVVQAIHRIFRGQYSYTTWLETSVNGETALAHFLNVRKAGHCEYFATATVLILRELGIPARYAVGYSMSEWDAGAGLYVVRGTDAHAWAMAKINGVWQAVDNTPPDWLSIENQDRASWQVVVDWFSSINFIIKKWRYIDEQKDSALWYWILAVMFIFLAYRTLKRVRTVEKERDKVAAVRADQDWLSLEDLLNKAGYQRRTGETLTHWFSRLLDGQWISVAKLFEKKWYAEHGLNDDEQVVLATKVKGLKNKLDQEKQERG